MAILSKCSQECFEKLGTALRDTEGTRKEMAELLKIAEEEVAKLGGGELMALRSIAQLGEEKLKALEGEKLEDVKTDGDKASATRVSGEAKKAIAFVKEGGGWRVDLEAELGCAAGKEEECEEGDENCEGSGKE